jgi:TolA-binding protein
MSVSPMVCIVPSRPVLFLLPLLLLASPLLDAQNSKENADFKLAINLYNDGLYDLAAEQLKQFIAAFPATPQGIDARFTLGLAQLKLKRYDEARLTFQSFALTYQDNPRAPEAWWNVGESYASVRNYKEAALAFERVKVFHPKSKSAPDALLQAGKNFTLAGARDDARRVFRIVVQEYPASGAVIAARTQLGQIYFDEGNPELAQSELKRVIEGDPSPAAKAQALLILGTIYAATGKPDQAASNYEEIIGAYKGTSAVQGAYVNLGKLQMSAGKPSQAVASLKRALAVIAATDSALLREALTALGDAYGAVGDYGSAVTSYDRFLAAFPGDERTPDILWLMALAASKGHSYRKSDEACMRLLRGVGAEPMKRRAQARLALNAEEQRNSALAVRLYGEFLDRRNDDPAAADVTMRMAGLLERELHDPAKAAAFYELVPLRFPQSMLVDDALAGAARCRRALKEPEKAAQVLRELLTRYPASEYCSDAEQRLQDIGIFEAKDKDAGVEKLALLVGDVVAEKDRTALSYRLGEIYFNDLKNYAAAVQQFTAFINSGVSDPRFVDALFLRAKAYEFLSRRDGNSRAQAIDAYRVFLSSYPKDRRAQEAAFALFALSAVDLGSARAALSATLTAMPEFARRDTLLLLIGTLEQKADSLAEALSTFLAIVHEMPSAPSAEEAWFRSLQILRAQGLTDSALAGGERYIAAFPRGKNAAAVLTLLAEAAAGRGLAAQAAEFYQRLTGDFFYTVAASAARQRLADALSASGNFAAAIGIDTVLINEQAANPLGDGTVDPALPLAVGRAYHLAGDFTEAKRYLVPILAGSRTGTVASAAATTLGMIYRAEGSRDVATAYFRQAAAASSESSVSRDVADMLFDSGDYAEALTQYARLRQASMSDSDRQALDARIIIARLRTDDIAQNEKSIAAFITTHGKSAEDLAAFEAERGNYFFRHQNYPSALKAFDKVLDTYDETSSVPEAMYWRGKTLEAIGKTEPAVQQYEKLLAMETDDPVTQRASLALGNIAYNAEKWDAAIKYYRRLVDDPKADPSLLPLAMSNLIETYQTAGLFDAALQLTRKYLELFPNRDDSFDKKITIGILYQRLGYYDQSVLHLQSLLDAAGSDLEGEIRYYIAEANYNKGDYQQAILDFLKVPYLVTKKGKVDWTANSLYMSGQSYEKMGRYDQALTMYQQIIDRTGIDETFKGAARKEIARVKLVLKRKGK